MNDTLADLETPCLLLDQTKLERNVNRMSQQIRKLRTRLRPHVKTAKSVPVAKLMCGGSPGPITVSTLREAEYFADAGFDDILYAVSIAPGKLPRVRRLMERGVDVTLLLDDLDAAKAVGASAVELGVEFRVLIEIDCDGKRAGLDPSDQRISQIACCLTDQSGTSFGGFLTHAGGAYQAGNIAEIQHTATVERNAVVRCADIVRGLGMECTVVSMGSTPTATFLDSAEGITEIRAGVYAFQDLFQAGLGVCDIDDIALSVLTTVIGHKRERNWLLTDSGALALSKDRSTLGQRVDQGYGLVCHAETGELIDGMYVADVFQEHGVIASAHDRLDLDRFPIGSQLRILPNHACMTSAAHDRYHVLRGTEIEAEWARCNGW